MAISVTMPLRIQPPCVVRVDDTVSILVENIIVERIDHFSGIDSARVIPNQPIVNWPQLNSRQQEIVVSSQQGQFLLQERRQLSFEGEKGRGNRSVSAVLG